MKRWYMIVDALLIVAVGSVSSWAQMMQRTDAVWARTVPQGTITVDGLLNETAWAVAESVLIRYDSLNSTVIPGSGWKGERSGGSWNGVVTDPTYATVKFLVQGNELIVGVTARDSSVGGGLFNECDGVLMNLRNHAEGQTPAPPYEYGYMWVTETWGDPNAGNPGASPAYFGPSKDDRLAYSGATHVNGVSSDDKNGGATLTPDGGYTMEIRFNLTDRGYDVTKPGGEIIEFTVSVYDADWQWPYNDSRFYGNRAWWQGQWGNSDTWNVGRIYARSDVTLSSGTAPELGPDLVIPNGSNYGSPAIDGDLSEPVWIKAPGFQITYGDTLLRQSYPGVGRWRSGQYQPKLSGATGTPPVLDPGNALFKFFFVADTLFIGIDVSDWFVTSNSDFDRWDGVRLTINSRDSLEKIDHALLCRLLDVLVDTGGHAQTRGFLRYLDSLGLATVAVHVKPGTTINNPSDIDAGYMIEMKLNLAPFGYPAGRGDGVLFLGATLFDHDAFLNPSDDYGTRTWFMREHDRTSAPAWAYMDPLTMVTSVQTQSPPVPERLLLLGNFPNPFNPFTTIRYLMPAAGRVALRVYDLLGRLVAEQQEGMQFAGQHELRFDGSALSSGVYLYRIELSEPGSHLVQLTTAGRMTLLK